MEIVGFQLVIFCGGQIARYILHTLLIGPLLRGYLLLIQPHETESVI